MGSPAGVAQRLGQAHPLIATDDPVIGPDGPVTGSSVRRSLRPAHPGAPLPSPVQLCRDSVGEPVETPSGRAGGRADNCPELITAHTKDTGAFSDGGPIRGIDQDAMSRSPSPRCRGDRSDPSAQFPFSFPFPAPVRIRDGGPAAYRGRCLHLRQYGCRCGGRPERRTDSPDRPDSEGPGNRSRGRQCTGRNAVRRVLRRRQVDRVGHHCAVHIQS